MQQSEEERRREEGCHKSIEHPLPSLCQWRTCEDDDDLLRVSHGGEAVCDQQDRPALAHRSQRCLDGRLSAHVQTAAAAGAGQGQGQNA